MKKVLVTGADGQLGKCLQNVAHGFPEIKWTFVSKQQLDLAQPVSVQDFFNRYSFDYCINTAAFTDVEGSESRQKEAFAINADAVRELAEICNEHNTCLVHISTDYVFDGTKKEPYKENDEVGPINAYGESKLRGENHIRERCQRYYIVRTSWLYSEHGHNFFRSVLRWADQGKDLTMTTEQLGSPTNANDLAVALAEMIENDNHSYGIYHFSNKGTGTWYDFAAEILTITGQIDAVNLAKTDHYRTFAKRPKYSVLDTTKIEKAFGINPQDWRSSLKNLITTINR